jgi:drug/metabolite transporter (DMT)-like permease
MVPAGDARVSASQWLWLIVLSILWGGAFFFIGVAVDGLPPLTIVFLRVALAALTLLPIVYLLGHRMPPFRLKDWTPFLGMSIFNNVIPFTAIVLAQTMIASGLASVLNAMTPIWTLVLLRLFTTDQPLTANKIIGVVLGFAGVAILMGPDAIAGRDSQIIGVLLVMLATLSYGCSAVWGRRLRGTPPVVSSAAQLAGSALLMIPLVAVIDQPWALSVPPIDIGLAVVGLAVISTAAAYLIFFHIITVSGTENVMLVTLLIPVSAITLGVVFLDEVLLSRHIIGALTIGAGLIAIDGRLFRRQRERAAE